MKKLFKVNFNNADYIVLGCSVKGKGKELNQDSFLVDADEDRVFCLLADGLGSAINSEIGSETVCKVARQIIEDQGLTEEFPYVLKKRWANELQVKPISCNTTFKFIVIEKDEIVFGGIGDGWIIGLVDGRFFGYKSINSFSNQTDSMMSVGYEDRFKIVRKPYEKIQILSLATDGFSEDIESGHEENFIKDCLLEINNDAEAFLDNLENMIINWPIKTNQDDKTIILCGGNK